MLCYCHRLFYPKQWDTEIRVPCHLKSNRREWDWAEEEVTRRCRPKTAQAICQAACPPDLLPSLPHHWRYRRPWKGARPQARCCQWLWGTLRQLTAGDHVCTPLPAAGPSVEQRRKVKMWCHDQHFKLFSLNCSCCIEVYLVKAHFTLSRILK